MKSKVIHTSVTANDAAQTLAVVLTMLGRLYYADRKRIMIALEAWFNAQV